MAAVNMLEVPKRQIGSQSVKAAAELYGLTVLPFAGLGGIEKGLKEKQ